MESNETGGANGGTRPSRNKMVATVVVAGLVVLVAIMVLLLAFPGGGGHSTPHAPVNPAMGGSPQESDHTNADMDDLQGGYGTGTDDAKLKDDNIERTQGSPPPVPAADSTAAK